MCDHPVVAVLTRQRPSLLTADQKKYIDNKADEVLAPYCLSSKQMDYAPFNATLPVCEPAEPSELFLFLTVYRNCKAKKQKSDQF